jgi:hypothetical protein
LVSAMNTSHSSLAPWTLLATTGPMNSVNYSRPYQTTLVILDHPSYWASSSSSFTLHPFGPTRSCHSPWQPCSSGLRCLSYYCTNSNPIVNVYRFILAALFFTARECDNIQLRLSARMLCWLINNGRNTTM